MGKINRVGKAKILTDRELSNIRKQLTKSQHQLIFDVLRFTGERIGAITQLERLDCYDARGNVRDIITFRPETRKADTKGKRKTRQVYLHPTLKETLGNFAPNQETRWLFPSPRNLENHISSQAVDELLRKAWDKAGLGGAGISLHSFRRTMITKLHEQGVAVGVIQKLTGHASLESVKEYIDVTELDLKKAIALL